MGVQMQKLRGEGFGAFSVGELSVEGYGLVPTLPEQSASYTS